MRSPVQDQLRSAAPVPGYLPPGGSVGSPFGPAAEGIFYTEGTPGIANWTRTEFVGADLFAELLSSAGHVLSAGGGTKLYRVESYERARSFLAGSSPSYALFYPGSVSAFADARLAAEDEIAVTLGARIDAFRADLDYRHDRVDFLAPGTRAGWKLGVTPRVGVSGPVPGTAGRTAFRFNYSQVAQPPDFRFFLDTTLGDSLRTDIRRQGNPDLAFEKGTSLEFGITHQIGESAGVSLVGFRKELNNLVTGSLRFGGFSKGQFTGGDSGRCGAPRCRCGPGGRSCGSVWATRCRRPWAWSRPRSTRRSRIPTRPVRSSPWRSTAATRRTWPSSRAAPPEKRTGAGASLSPPRPRAGILSTAICSPRSANRTPSARIPPASCPGSCSSTCAPRLSWETCPAVPTAAGESWSTAATFSTATTCSRSAATRARSRPRRHRSSSWRGAGRAAPSRGNHRATARSRIWTTTGASPIWNTGRCGWRPLWTAWIRPCSMTNRSS